MTSTSDWSVALIGAGRIAHDHAQAIAASDSIHLAGVADPAESAREGLADGKPTFERFEDLLRETQPNAVVISSPPNTHESIAIAALEAGCHVLCEKPLATTSAAAERMLAAAQKAERTLMLASKFRFGEDVRQATDLLQRGEIGRPVLYDGVFTGKVAMSDRWNANPEVAGGGVLFDNGSHAFDLARTLLGPIKRVSARRAASVQPLAVEDTVRLWFETERDQVLGDVMLSWSLESGTPHYATVVGTEGALQLGWGSSRWRRNGASEWTDFGDGYAKGAAFAAQLEHLRAVATDGEAPRITNQDALASVACIEAAYRSAELGAWAEVTPEPST